MSSFKNECYKHAMELSKYIWNLKDKNMKYTITWCKVKQAKSYTNVTKKCNSCLLEKYFIICKPEMCTLNNKNELISGCRQSKKFLLNTALIWLLVFVTNLTCCKHPFISGMKCHAPYTTCHAYYLLLCFPYIFDCNRYFWQLPSTIRLYVNLHFGWIFNPYLFG